MEQVNPQKRYNALFSFCMVDVLPHCELWKTAHAEFMRLHALGYRLF
jgi:hypothetical protein